MAEQKAQNKPTWIDGQGWRYPLQSRQTRRMNNHDYHEAGIYLITMSVEGRECVFGEIVGNIRARKDSDDFPHIKAIKIRRTNSKHRNQENKQILSYGRSLALLSHARPHPHDH